MDIVIAAIKSDLNSVLDAGRYMLTGLFIVAVFHIQHIHFDIRGGQVLYFLYETWDSELSLKFLL